MCLQIHGEPVLKTAEEDITVYKVFYKDGDVYLSPFQHVEYNIGSIYSAELGLSAWEKDYNINFKEIGIDNPPDYRVSQGIHTFTDFDEAKRVADRRFDGRGCVCTAIIPKGSKYYEGVWYFNRGYGFYTVDELKSIVSTDLIVVGEC